MALLSTDYNALPNLAANGSPPMLRIAHEALTFDDVLLLPDYSEVVARDVSGYRKLMEQSKKYQQEKLITPMKGRVVRLGGVRLVSTIHYCATSGGHKSSDRAASTAFSLGRANFLCVNFIGGPWQLPTLTHRALQIFR